MFTKKQSKNVVVCVGAARVQVSNKMLWDLAETPAEKSQVYLELWMKVLGQASCRQCVRRSALIVEEAKRLIGGGVARKHRQIDLVRTQIEHRRLLEQFLIFWNWALRLSVYCSSVF